MLDEYRPFLGRLSDLRTVLYRGAGYAPIANFNRNPVASFFGEKWL